MISEPLLKIPYAFDRDKEPDKKLMRLMKHNFRHAGYSLARFGHGGFFSLDYNFWDGLPLDGVVMLRTIYTLPDCRGQGIQRAIINTVTSMAYKSGCAVLAVAHTFETKTTIKTEEDFVDVYGWEFTDPFDYFGPDSKENRSQNAAFKRAGWQNIDVHENIGTPWITPEYCWIMVPETASQELKQQLKPRLVETALSPA
jgi:GNAT superfamily N-acetyltransferase